MWYSYRPVNDVVLMNEFDSADDLAEHFQIILMVEFVPIVVYMMSEIVSAKFHENK